MTHSEQHPTSVMNAQLMCTPSDLVIYNQSGEACDRLDGLAPMKLSTTLTFGDTANDELVTLLMPAQLAIKTTFYAKPLHSGRDVVLGSIILNTMEGILSYPLELEIPDPVALGLLPNTAYYIGATLRLGTAPYGRSSFLRGDLDGTQLIIGTPVVEEHADEESAVEEATVEESTLEEATFEAKQPIEESAIEENSDAVDESPASEEVPEADAPSTDKATEASSTNTRKSTASRRKRTKKTA